MRNLGRALEIMGLASMPRDGRKYIEKAGFVDIKVNPPFSFNIPPAVANLTNNRHSSGTRRRGHGQKIRK